MMSVDGDLHQTKKSVETREGKKSGSGAKSNGSVVGIPIGVAPLSGWLGNVPVLFYRFRPGSSFNGVTCSENRFRTLTGHELADLAVVHDDLPFSQLYPMLALVIPQDRQRVVDVARPAIEREEPYELKYRIRHKDGSIRSLLDTGVVSVDVLTGSRVVHGVIVVSDRHEPTPKCEHSSDAAVFEKSGRLVATLEKERGRLARELHDGVGQLLTTAALRLERAAAALRAADTLDGRTVAALDDVEAAGSLARHTLEEVRSVCNGLRPAVLDDLGIVAALRWLVRCFQEVRPGVQLHADIALKESDIPEALKIEVFRTAQEALNNVVKHADAEHVWLHVGADEKGIVLVVRDDGRGLRKRQGLPFRCITNGFGIVGMRQRVDLSGGHFSVEDHPDGGAVVSATWLRDCDRPRS